MDESEIKTDVRQTYHAELDALRDEVIRVAGLVTENIERGTQSFLAEDLRAIEELIRSDTEIDQICDNVEERIYTVLATQQPMASDLRTLVSILRMIHEIERSGDLMVNIAKAGRKIYPHEINPKLRGLIQQMGRQAQVMFKAAIDAYAEGDVDKAGALDEMDDFIDDIQRDLLKQLISTQEEELDVSIRVALVGRFFERIADHAVNIGERVVYIATGAIPLRA